VHLYTFIFLSTKCYCYSTLECKQQVLCKMKVRWTWSKYTVKLVWKIHEIVKGPTSWNWVVPHVKVVEKNHGRASKSHSTLEISVKSGKDSTSTLSLVIHRMRLKKNLKKSTLALRGGETQKTIKIDGFLSFTLSFFSPERLHCCYIYFHCSYLNRYYNSSRTLCIICWDSAFRTEI
jgi:hypothetical protein